MYAPYYLRNSSGNFATFAAIRRASSFRHHSSLGCQVPFNLPMLRGPGGSQLLNRDGIPPDELWPRIDVGKARARIILAEHRKRALKLVGHLFQYGRVSRAEFSSSMMGDV
jgi:hypothetical protein